MILVGRGGEKGRNNKTKKRKWNGLNPEAMARYHVAEGPVVGVYVAFLPTYSRHPTNHINPPNLTVQNYDAARGSDLQRFLQQA